MKRKVELVEMFDEQLEDLRAEFDLDKETFLEWLLGYVDYQLDLEGNLNLERVKYMKV